MSSKRDRTKLAGQLGALVEHIEKEQRYEHPYDKAFARKTQENVIERINRILQRYGWGRSELERIISEEGLNLRDFEDIIEREGW